MKISPEYISDFLRAEGVNKDLIDEADSFRKEHSSADSSRLVEPPYLYYGKSVWEKSIAAILAGENLLLAGSKATGKNILAQNLACLFGRPLYDISFHINVDSSYLIGSDTYDGTKVTFRPGPIYSAAKDGGFAVLDEINMARNEALAVLHAALDFRRVIELSGYERLELHPAARFIATMNYGYAGTRDLNEALCSRFAVLSMRTIEEKDLSRLIEKAFPDMNKKILSQFVALFFEIEKKAAAAEISERALDLRGLLDAIRLMQKGIASGDALEICLVNKTFDEYERGLVRDLINARLPADLGKAEIFS